MSRVARALAAFLVSSFLMAWSLPAQQEQSPDPSVPQKLTKAQKRKMKNAYKELDDQYKQWLNEDVVYIISPEERSAFLQLATTYTTSWDTILA